MATEMRAREEKKNRKNNAKEGENVDFPINLAKKQWVTGFRTIQAKRITHGNSGASTVIEKPNAIDA